jgi:hypothetical protein
MNGMSGWERMIADQREEIARLRTECQAAREEGRRDGLMQAVRLCEHYGRDARLEKEFACETADELAAQIRALKPEPSVVTDEAVKEMGRLLAEGGWIQEMSF